MAVLDEVPGIEVTIQINGQDVTEYDLDPQESELDYHDMDPECSIVSKYIEAIDETEFSIKVAIDDAVYAWSDIKHYLIATVTIDGTWMATHRLPQGYGGQVIKGKTGYSERSQQWYCRQFKFSVLSRDDNCTAAQIKKDIETTKYLGLIQVGLERAVPVNKSERKSVPIVPGNKSKRKVAPIVNINTPRVAEKALKGRAISHSTSFSNKEAIMKPEIMSCCRVEGDSGPIATCRFLYRSKESLKQELIIPRTPSPTQSALGSSKSVDNMTIAELRRLAQERLDQINWAEQAKSRDKSVVKREVSEIVDIDEKPGKARAAKRQAVTIDLTDD